MHTKGTCFRRAATALPTPTPHPISRPPGCRSVALRICRRRAEVRVLILLILQQYSCWCLLMRSATGSPSLPLFLLSKSGYPCNRILWAAPHSCHKCPPPPKTRVLKQSATSPTKGKAKQTSLKFYFDEHVESICPRALATKSKSTQKPRRTSEGWERSETGAP